MIETVIADVYKIQGTAGNISYEASVEFTAEITLQPATLGNVLSVDGMLDGQYIAECFDGGLDIDEGDKLVIDGTDYIVSKKSDWSGFSFNHFKMQLSKKI